MQVWSSCPLMAGRTMGCWAWLRASQRARQGSCSSHLLVSWSASPKPSAAWRLASAPGVTRPCVCRELASDPLGTLLPLLMTQARAPNFEQCLPHAMPAWQAIHQHRETTGRCPQLLLPHRAAHLAIVTQSASATCPRTNEIMDDMAPVG